MKLALYGVLFGVFLTCVSLRAQDGTLTTRKQKVVQTTQQVVKVKPAPISIEGIVSQIFKSKQPLQMINPLAPAKYGSGDQNISRDPNTGKAEGFVVLGIQW